MIYSYIKIFLRWVHVEYSSILINTILFAQQKFQKDVAEIEAPDEGEVYKEQFGLRFIIRGESFSTRLQANIAEDGHAEHLENVSTAFRTKDLEIDASFSYIAFIYF